MNRGGLKDLPRDPYKIKLLFAEAIFGGRGGASGWPVKKKTRLKRIFSTLNQRYSTQGQSVWSEVTIFSRNAFSTMFAYILYNRSTRMVQLLYIHHPLCVCMKLIVNTNLYIKSLRKLNKVAIDMKFIALPLIKWYFKINFTRCGL